MNYYVVDLTNGQKYGPADIATLNQWVTEGRITAQTMLEDAATGVQVLATQVPGIALAPAPPSAPVTPPQAPYTSPPVGEYQAPPGGPYQASPGLSTSMPGQKEATSAWVWFVVGLLCCSIIGYPMSIVSANKAAALGNQSANVAKILSIILLVISVLAIPLYIRNLGSLTR